MRAPFHIALRAIISIATLAALSAISSQARGVDAPEVKLRIEATDRAPRGGVTGLIFIVEIPAGWHIHANAPSHPYLVPTELRLTLPPGIAA